MPETLTPEQFAMIIQKERPHLIEIQQHIEEVQYGTVTVEIVVRAGVPNKMEFVEKKTWLKDKT